MKRRHQDRRSETDTRGRAACVIGSVVFSSDCAANLPSATMTFGLTMSICRNRNGSQRSTSSGSGIAVAGRAALDDVGDVDVARASSRSPR